MSDISVFLPPVSWRQPVAAAGDLPSEGNQDGDAIVTQDTDVIYIWTGSSWSAVTASGGFNAQTANTVFAGPSSGPSAAPAFRALVSADIPDSVALTGVPTAPTAAPATSTTQLATTAFVQSQGFIGSTAAMPSAHASSTSVVTSATTTYVTAISTSITTTAASSPVYAKATATFTVTGAVPTVLKYRVSINGVAGQEQLLSLTAVTTNYTAAVQYISGNLAPGTYTVLFEIARNSGTGTVSFFEGTLDAIGLQGSNSNGITQLTGALQAGPGSGSQVLSGILPLANGGTNANLTATNGAVIYSTATAFGKTAAGSTGQLLRSAGAASPTWTTVTFPATTTINQLLYSSAANVISGLATVNTGALVTSSTGVPSIASGATANRLLRTNGTTVSFAQAALTTDVSGILPGANGGTGVTMFASTRVPFSNGTTYAADALFLYQTSNTRFIVGQGGGTGRINGTVSLTDPSPNDLAGNFFSRTTGNNCVNIQNENTLITLNMTNSGGIALGANILAGASRGTLPARTQSQTGDALFTLLAQGRTVSAWSAGFAGAVSIVTTENVTDTTNGGEIVLSTTPNGGAVPVENVRIKNSGETVFQKAIATAQYTTAAKNALTPSPGWVVYDTDLNQLSYYNGTTWINL